MGQNYASHQNDQTYQDNFSDALANVCDVQSSFWHMFQCFSFNINNRPAVKAYTFATE